MMHVNMPTISVRPQLCCSCWSQRWPAWARSVWLGATLQTDWSSGPDSTGNTSTRAGTRPRESEREREGKPVCECVAYSKVSLSFSLSFSPTFSLSYSLSLSLSLKYLLSFSCFPPNRGTRHNRHSPNFTPGHCNCPEEVSSSSSSSLSTAATTSRTCFKGPPPPLRSPRTLNTASGPGKKWDPHRIVGEPHRQQQQSRVQSCSRHFAASKRTFSADKVRMTQSRWVLTVNGRQMAFLLYWLSMIAAWWN